MYQRIRKFEGENCSPFRLGKYRIRDVIKEIGSCKHHVCHVNKVRQEDKKLLEIENRVLKYNNKI